MKIVIDSRTGKKSVVYKKFELDKDATSCPECKRIFKEHDVKFLSENDYMSCSKCGSKLSYKK